MRIKALKFNQKGFSLLELIIVIIMASFLMTMAVARYGKVNENAIATEGLQILHVLLQAQKQHIVEFGAYAADPNDLDTIYSQPKYFATPTVAAPADPVANPIVSITRTGIYTLDINENGEIRCINIGVNTICNQLNLSASF